MRIIYISDLYISFKYSSLLSPAGSVLRMLAAWTLLVLTMIVSVVNVEYDSQLSTEITNLNIYPTMHDLYHKKHKDCHPINIGTGKHLNFLKYM